MTKQYFTKDEIVTLARKVGYGKTITSKKLREFDLESRADELNALCEMAAQVAIGKPAAADNAGGDEPVAWVECDGELIWNNREAAIGRNLYTRPQPQAELNSWSVLAARALDDAYRVLETIEPESSSEADSLSELSNRVQELFVQAMVLHGFKTRKEMDAAKHFNRIAIDTSMLNAAPKPQADKPIAWGMPQPDGRIFDVICPEEHALVEGDYTVPLCRCKTQGGE